MSVFDFASAIASFLATGWLVKTIFAGNDDRADEDEARQFFDRHGHWPDEDPAEADRRYEL